MRNIKIHISQNVKRKQAPTAMLLFLSISPQLHKKPPSANLPKAVVRTGLPPAVNT